jgi:predicted RNA polymerase sigma factor
VADAFRQEWGRINAALIHQTGDWDLAEECAQDAFAQALRRWPGDGVPDRPGAWLMTVARNGAIDRLRRRRSYRAKVEELAVMAARETGTDDGAAPEADVEDGGVPDERLRLIFTCCHPDWPRIARLYRLLAGLTGSPVVELNRAVAVAMADGPAAGLALLRRLEAGGALAGYYLLPATRADFLRRLGRGDEAVSAYEEAAALAGTGPERRFLNARLAQVRSQARRRA